MKSQTIGHDSEFGLMQGGQIVSALDAFNEDVHTTEAGRFFADNMNCEIAIEPVTTLDKFHQYTEDLLGAVRGMGYELVMKPTIKYPERCMEHKMARVSGCNPDYSPYHMATNDAPDFTTSDSTRSCGAHIHASLAPDQDPYWFSRWMDVYVGLPLLFAEEKSTRRDMYGKAGCMRVKPYGAEYRVLSNVWLDDPVKREFVWHGTHKAIEMSNVEPEEIMDWWDVPMAIDSHDLELAQRCIDRLYMYGVKVL